MTTRGHAVALLALPSVLLSTPALASAGVVEIVQLSVFVVVMFAALVSAIIMIRDRAQAAQENAYLRQMVRELTNRLGNVQNPSAGGDLSAVAELRELEANIYSASELLSSRSSVISRAPAEWIVSILRLVFSRRAFDSIFSQVVIDGREEYFDALEKGQSRLAQWRLVQIYLILVFTAFTWTGVSVFQKVSRLWRLG